MRDDVLPSLGVGVGLDFGGGIAASKRVGMKRQVLVLMSSVHRLQLRMREGSNLGRLDDSDHWVEMRERGSMGSG